MALYPEIESIGSAGHFGGPGRCDKNSRLLELKASGLAQGGARSGQRQADSRPRCFLVVDVLRLPFVVLKWRN